MPMLTVAENVLLGSEPRGGGFVRRRALRRRYEQLADAAGFDLPGDLLAGRLRTAEQQQVEILRALARDARVIVMDEPSAALSGPDTERLHEIVRALVARGQDDRPHLALPARGARAGRHGHGAARRRVWSRRSPAASATEQSLVEAMLGRPLTAAFPPKAAAARRCAGRALGPRGSPRAASPAPRSRCGAARSSGSRARGRGADGARPRDLRCGRVGAGGGHGRAGRPLRGGPRRAAALGGRDDPRVAQGRGPDLHALRARERDALAKLGDAEPLRVRATRARSAQAARRDPRPLRCARRELHGARSARCRAATSRRCCSRGCCCASRA